MAECVLYLREQHDSSSCSWKEIPYSRWCADAENWKHVLEIISAHRKTQYRFFFVTQDGWVISDSSYFYCQFHKNGDSITPQKVTRASMEPHSTWKKNAAVAPIEKKTRFEDLLLQTHNLGQGVVSHANWSTLARKIWGALSARPAHHAAISKFVNIVWSTYYNWKPLHNFKNHAVDRSETDFNYDNGKKIMTRVFWKGLRTSMLTTKYTGTRSQLVHLMALASINPQKLLYTVDNTKFCMQQGCKHKAQCILRLKHEYTADGRLISESGAELPRHRKFCTEHAKNRNYNKEDCDANYVSTGNWATIAAAAESSRQNTQLSDSVAVDIVTPAQSITEFVKQCLAVPQKIYPNNDVGLRVEPLYAMYTEWLNGISAKERSGYPMVQQHLLEGIIVKKDGGNIQVTGGVYKVCRKNCILAYEQIQRFMKQRITVISAHSRCRMFGITIATFYNTYEDWWKNCTPSQQTMMKLLSLSQFQLMLKDLSVPFDATSQPIIYRVFRKKDAAVVVPELTKRGSDIVSGRATKRPRTLATIRA